MSPIHFAALNGHKKIIEYLFNAGSNIFSLNQKVNSISITLHHFSVLEITTKMTVLHI